MVLQIFRKSRPAPPEAKASAAAPVVAFQGAGRAAWSARDTATLTRVGFLRQPGGVPLREADRRGGGGGAGGGAGRGPAVRRASGARPARRAQSGAGRGGADGGLLRAPAADAATGIWRRRARAPSGGPRELYVLRSDRMKVVPGADGWPVAYEYSAGAQKHVFDMRQDRVPVLHVKSFHPQDDHYGLSPLDAAASAIDVHNSAQHLVEGAARQRGAAFGGDRLQGRGRAGAARRRTSTRGWSRSWRATTRGRATPGGRCCSRAGSTGSRWASRPRDMEFHRTKEAAARDVALAFGVPPMLLGLPGDNTYANYPRRTGRSTG